ncbi:MAG: hypothetical protein KCHDKBKB_02501 [Elusimicrobia bacterium]|nr:hypothetical protein [Elusimicrobiota bacterium]
MAFVPFPGVKNTHRPSFSLFDLGFRPFFLGASVFACLTITLWMAVYVFQLSLPLQNLSPSQWHAHEMIYGYSMAVIAGFLLTAVRNWTQIQTPQGRPLIVLFSLWLTARILFFFGTRFVLPAAILDLCFILFLTVAILYPIIKARQWHQLEVVAKLLFLAVGQVVFYLGVWGHLQRGVYWGLYGGLYLLIGLVMMMGARLIPNFIQNGVGYHVELHHPKWIAVISLLLYLMFFISELFLNRDNFTSIVSAGLFVVITIRLIGWHTYGIWKKPLLWSLFLSFIFIDIGFLLFATRPFLGLAKVIPMHAMAFGGIGLVTMGMMARVALGHSGRNIHEAPRTVFYSCAALALGAIVRVGVSVIDAGHYSNWVGVAQALWILGFLLFVYSYAPILIGPDVEKQG